MADKRKKKTKARPRISLPDLLGPASRFRPSPILPQGTRNTRDFQFFDAGTRTKAVPRHALRAVQQRGSPFGGRSRESVL